MSIVFDELENYEIIIQRWADEITMTEIYIWCENNGANFFKRINRIL